MTGWPMILLGALMAGLSLSVAFFAGSDAVRIHGSHRLLMAGASSLALAALCLEYRA